MISELEPRDLANMQGVKRIVMILGQQDHRASEMVQLYEGEHIPERKAIPELARSPSRAV